MDVHVTLEGRGDLAARIYRQLLDAVLDGRLRSGERLPPTRELARSLEVSRNTVAVAYERLTAEGFLTSRVGAGTFVGTEPVAAASGSRSGHRRARPGGGVRPRPVWGSMPPAVADREPAPRYDFRVGLPDAGLFPLETWRRLVSPELRRSAIRPAYGAPSGHPGLRTAIARYIGVARSVHAGPDDVLVTQGAQQALDLIARVLIEPGMRVAVEEPGYPPARHLFRTTGARVVGVPVDAEGLEVAAIPPGTRLVYVTPSHQFPLGTPMSLGRRTALLAWAERHGAVVIEDDYDSEFRFSDRPLEPLQSLDRSGRVVYVGSFSKTLVPMLRLGFLVAPASLQAALRSAKQLADWHGDLVTQGALARFIDDGLLARHVRKASREYTARHEQIVAALRRDFADWLELVPSAAGLHVCTRVVADSVDVAAVVRVAARADVAVQPLAKYCGEMPVHDGLVIGYGAVRPERIPDGLRLLAEAFRHAQD